ncbi:MAG: hypothetical protein NVS4B8_29240 [Herpetosiphon sp.]
MTTYLPNHSPSPDHQARMDAALRAALVVEPPAELQAQLLLLTTQLLPPRVELATRSALILDPPPELHARLMSLVPATRRATVPAVAARRHHWAAVAYATAFMAIGMVLVLGTTLYGQWLDQTGLTTLFLHWLAMPGVFLGRLYTVVPTLQVIVHGYVLLQQPLQWLLVALMMIGILQMRPPRTRTLI